MRLGIWAASAAVSLSFVTGAAVKAEPTLTSGIGLASCAKIGPALKPGAGLDHLPNALLFYWTQGYISAVNVFLLNKYADYIDAGAVTEPDVTQRVFDFCAANPDKKPVSAIDKMIRDANKFAANKSDAMDFWEHKPPVATATPSAPAAPPAASSTPALASPDAGKLTAAAGGVLRINLCVADNRDEGAARAIVLKYCTCMSNKMDASETKSITEWEKANATQRRACDKESGWK